MSKIIINNTDIRLRPSSIDGFLNCPKQWAHVFLEGRTSVPGARAAIGTAIHKAAEVIWSEAIETQKVDDNIEKLTDAAIEEFHEVEARAELNYDEGEDTNTAQDTVKKGVKAFVEDIVPYTPIPLGVEKFFKVDIDHPFVKELGGTIDYITNDVVADVKTSRRKAVMNHYVTQQSIYKYLAIENGYDIKHSLIQNVILRKSSTEGQIGELEPNVPQAKFIINTLLDTLELAAKDTIPLDTLFRGNPKYYLCSEKYCAFYKECEYT